MNQLTDAVNRYLKHCDWRDIALLKLCVCALGVLVGLGMPWRKKWVTAWVASLIFVATYVPLMGKFLPFLLGERVEIKDIYREKQL